MGMITYTLGQTPTARKQSNISYLSMTNSCNYSTDSTVCLKIRTKDEVLITGILSHENVTVFDISPPRMNASTSLCQRRMESWDMRYIYIYNELKPLYVVYKCVFLNKQNT